MRLNRFVIASLAATAATTGIVGLTGAPASAAPSPVTVTFADTGEHPFTVPAGVTSLHVVAIGGRGGGGYATGGRGAQVEGDVTVKPGQTIYAEVGGNGDPAIVGFLVQEAWLSKGGAGGGGDGGEVHGASAELLGNPVSGGGGGGASDVRTCSITDNGCSSLGSRLLVAGGGGGAGTDSSGGNGGTPNGSPGTLAANSQGPGQGATTTQPGAGGLDYSGQAPPGNPGWVGAGGAGTDGLADSGGGGGGGWFGGGGGNGGVVIPQYGGGGGGGSSYGPAGTTYSLSADSPSVTITYTPADTTPPTVTITAPAANATYLLGQQVPAQYSCSDGTDGSGVASCSGDVPSGGYLDTSTGGYHAFTVTSTDQAGNTSHLSVSYVVSLPVTVATLTRLSATPATVGLPVTYTAQVVPAPPAGTVDFQSAAADIPSCQAVPVDTGTGIASCTFTPATAGSYAIDAHYSGTQGYGGSSAPTLTEVVQGWPTLSLHAIRAREGSGGTTPFAFRVTLNHASAGPVTVQWATHNGTARAPSDYQAAAGVLTIPAGATGGTITVLVNGDRIKEANETFTVRLSGPTGATIAIGAARGTILNDD